MPMLKQRNPQARAPGRRGARRAGPARAAAAGGDAPQRARDRSPELTRRRRAPRDRRAARVLIAAGRARARASPGWRARSRPTTPTASCSSACSRARSSSWPTWSGRSRVDVRDRLPGHLPLRARHRPGAHRQGPRRSTSPAATSSLVEDIVDTGLTLAYLLRPARPRAAPASSTVCALLDRPARRIVPLDRPLRAASRSATSSSSATASTSPSATATSTGRRAADRAGRARAIRTRTSRRCTGERAPTAALSAGGAVVGRRPDGRRRRVIRLSLVGVRVEVPTNQPIVLLREDDGQRYLPIFIGPPEATAIVFALQGVETPAADDPRPLRDRARRPRRSSVERIVITELRDGTFYAEIELDRRRAAATGSRRRPVRRHRPGGPPRTRPDLRRGGGARRGRRRSSRATTRRSRSSSSGSSSSGSARRTSLLKGRLRGFGLARGTGRSHGRSYAGDVDARRRPRASLRRVQSTLA